MRAKILVLSAVVFLASAACFAANPTSSPADDTKAVQQATAQFYTSLNAMFTGDAGPMQEIWSHADDVTYMGPGGGFLVGWNAVRETWEAQAALKLGGKIEPDQMRVTVGQDLAFSNATRRATTRTPRAKPCKFRSGPPICSARKTASGK